MVKIVAFQLRCSLDKGLTVQSNRDSTCVAYELGGDVELRVVFASSSKLCDVRIPFFLGYGAATVFFLS